MPYSDKYDAAHVKARRRISTEVSQILRDDGIRFLKLDYGAKAEWVESDPRSVEDKIGQLFRTLRKKKEAKGNP